MHPARLLCPIAALALVVSAASAQLPDRTPVTILVLVPEGAAVTVDGNPVSQTGPERRLITPPLEVGKTYRYTFAASFTRDGKPVTVSKAVEFRPLQEVVVDLTGEVPPGKGSEKKPDPPKTDDKKDPPKKKTTGERGPPPRDVTKKPDEKKVPPKKDRGETGPPPRDVTNKKDPPKAPAGERGPAPRDVTKKPDPPKKKDVAERGPAPRDVSAKKDPPKTDPGERGPAPRDVTAKKADPKKKDDTIRVPFVPTSQPLVAEMLKLAKVTKDDVVCDLGCGDGRIVVTAVKDFKAKKGVGIDINPARVKESAENAKKAGVADKVEFREGDVLKLTDFSEATVVTLYLFPEVNERLAPVLKKTLKPGSRIVSHDFDLGDDWKPDKTVKVKDVDGSEHFLFLWTIK